MLQVGRKMTPFRKLERQFYKIAKIEEKSFFTPGPPSRLKHHKIALIVVVLGMTVKFLCSGHMKAKNDAKMYICSKN